MAKTINGSTYLLGPVLEDGTREVTKRARGEEVWRRYYLVRSASVVSHFGVNEENVPCSVGGYLFFFPKGDSNSAFFSGKITEIGDIEDNHIPSGVVVLLILGILLGLTLLGWFLWILLS